MTPLCRTFLCLISTLAVTGPVLAQPRVFVSNEGDGSVSVIDLDAGEVVATIAVGARPRGIGVSPDGERLYVALGSDNEIAAVDTRSLEVVQRIPAGSDPEAFAVHPNGNIYVSNEDEATATVIDPASGKHLAVLTVGIEPEGVAVSHGGDWVIVAAESTSTIHVFSVPEHEAVATLLVGARPREAVFSPDDRWLYVTSEIGREVTKVDMRSRQIVNTTRLRDPRTKPKGLALSADGKRLFVAAGSANTVVVLDAETLEPGKSIAVGRRPWGVALSPDGRFLYTTNGLDDSVSVVDTQSERVVQTIPVGERPWGLAVLAR